MVISPNLNLTVRPRASVTVSECGVDLGEQKRPMPALRVRRTVTSKIAAALAEDLREASASWNASRNTDSLPGL